ncbi:MAG: hypothetical protein R3D00_08425 [Bacteroidia bacterium]
MEIFHTVLMVIHILAGAFCLLGGAYLIIAPGKGNARHKQLGRLFTWCMATIVATAFIMIGFFRFNIFLLVVSIFSGYLTFSGYRVLRRKTPGSHTHLDYWVAVATMLTGIGLAGYGGWILMINGSRGMVLAILCMVFAFFIFMTSRTDLIVFRQTEMQDRLWWKYHHMRAMIGAFIAVFTAFLVNNMGNFIPDFGFNWIIWILPAAVGVPLSGYWAKLMKRELALKKTVKKSEVVN